jgi:hypothetical protein
MSYRNIDSDERLLIMARRYWDEEDQLNETQYRWVLKNEGYSEREIDNAISDYWDIHLRSNILLHYWIAPILLTLLMLVLVWWSWNLIVQMDQNHEKFFLDKF